MSEFSNDFTWQGRIDAEDGEAGLRWHQKIQPPGLGQSIGLLGFASDLGVTANKGRPGAVAGPDTIRAQLANMAWHGTGTLTDCGTIRATNDLTQAQADYASVITKALQQHDHIIGLGGGHEIAWGSYSGLRGYLDKDRADARIGIINFDAHFDLRRPAPHISSGTPFWQIAQACKAQGRPFRYCCLGVAPTANTPALYAFADAHQVGYLHDLDCTLSATQALLTPMLNEVDELYVTICLDAFPAALAPGVSAPSALGISPHYVIAILKWLQQQRDCLGFQWRLSDIAEMNPSFDQDNRTAKLAARLAFEIAHAD